MKTLYLNLKDRLFCHWITSIIGLAVLIAASVLLFLDVISTEVFCYAMPSVLPLFFSKDSWLINLFTLENRLKVLLIIALFGIAYVLSGCYTREKCNQLFPPTITVHDSIHTEYSETIRDTTIQIPADSSWLRAWLKCDSAGNVIIDHSAMGNGVQSDIQFQLKGNVLYVKFMKDAYEMRLQLKDKLIKYYRDKQTTIEHTTNILKPWQKTLLWVAAGMILLNICAIDRKSVV